MASTIKIKNSSTAGAVPTSSDLVQGELAINVTDRRIFTENASGTVVELGTPSIDDNGNATAITIDSSENVGIGETSPSSILHVSQSTAADATLKVQNKTTNYAASFNLIASNNNGAIYNNISSSTNGGTTHWAIAGGGVASTMTFQTGGSERMRIDSSGNLLVGTTALNASNLNGTALMVDTFGSFVDVGHNSTSTSGLPYTRFRYSGTLIGSITQSGTTAVLYNTTSDYRLKNVIGPVADAGERIDALEPIEYEWKADGSRTRGFLAHKFQEVYPQSVSGEKDAVDEEGNPQYQNMQASTPEVIADLIAEIQSLRKRLAALENK